MFKRSRNKDTDKINLKTREAETKGKKYSEYSGLLVDKKLSWKEHIRGIDIITKLAQFVSKNVPTCIRTILYIL